MVTVRASGTPIQRFASDLHATQQKNGTVDGATMENALRELGQDADVDLLRGMLSSNRDGQLDPAARSALRSFILASQHGTVPTEATVRGFSLQLQSRLVQTATAVAGMNGEIAQASDAVGRLDGRAGARELKAALRDLAAAEAAAAAAVDACAAAKNAGKLVLEAYSLTVPSDGRASPAPTPDASIDHVLATLTASLGSLGDARDRVACLIEHAMAGKPVSVVELANEGAGLRAAVVDLAVVHELLRRV